MRASCAGAAWAVDFSENWYSEFPKYYEVFNWCVSKWGGSVSHELRWASRGCLGEKNNEIFNNPHWFYDFDLSSKGNIHIYVLSDNDIAELKTQFEIE